DTSFAKYQDNPAHNAGRWTDTHKTYDLWNKYEQPGHKWVMAIDLNACTGCGSCIVACNLENNLPVERADRVRRRRDVDWLAIDVNACPGCGPCIVACNLENKIPWVGRDAVRRRREMHWIRIDRYYAIEQDGQAYTKEDDIRHLDDMENVSVVHQPMLCQH